MARQQAYRAAAAGKPRGSKVGTTKDSVQDIVIAPRRLLMTAAVLLCAGLFTLPVQAQTGPFAGMAGHWTGGGTVNLEDGATERIRCRANYAVAGAELGLTLTCASDSYKFNLEGRVVAGPGGVVTGTWSESSRNISGSLHGRGGSGSFQVVASGPGFNASISLSTRGNRQSISMRADSQFRGASIALSR
jgi:hypothetical protein